MSAFMISTLNAKLLPKNAPAATVAAEDTAVVPQATELTAYKAGTAPPAVIITATAVATIAPPISQ